MNAPAQQYGRPKVPPHSLEAEQSVLGGVILNPRAWYDVVAVLSSADFYRPQHQLIFEAMGRLVDRNVELDVVTITDELGDQLERAGGIGYLAEVIEGTPGASNVLAYARIVREHAIARALIGAAHRIGEMAFADDGRPVADKLNEAQAEIMGLAIEQRLVTARAMRDVLHDVVQDIEHRYKELGADKDAVRGLSTGFVDLDHRWRGLKPGNLYVLAGRPSMGKAQPLDEPVLTPDGWRAMGHLSVGDFVVGADGNPTRVTGVFPQGPCRVWRVNFRDGRTVRCTEDHLWTVHCSKWEAPRTISTREIRMLLERKRYHGRLRVQPYEGGELDGIDVVGVDPYVLGCWLGDGCTNGNIHGLEPMMQTLQASGAPMGAVHGYGPAPHVLRTTVRGLRVALREMGLLGKRAHEKEIPEAYMRAPRDQRLALLQGLMDTDGWVESFGCARFSSASPVLARQVRELVWSLGGEATIRVKKTTHRDAHVVTIRMPRAKELFRLPSKKARCQEPRDYISPRIESVVETDEVAPCQCISVSRADGLYVTRDYVVTHNTTLAMNIAQHVAANGHRVLVFSLEMTAEELAERAIASTGGIAHHDLESGSVFARADGPGAFTGAVSRLSPLDLFIDDTAGMDLPRIRARTRQLSVERPVRLVLIDHLQLMSGEGRTETEILSNITKGAKAIAKELRCPVVLLSQLSREVDKRPYGKNRPVMSDLRGSGSIEQDADLIAFIYRNAVYKPSCAFSTVAEVITAKFRNGRIGTDYLQADLERCRFRNYGGEKPQYDGGGSTAADEFPED